MSSSSSFSVCILPSTSKRIYCFSRCFVPFTLPSLCTSSFSSYCSPYSGIITGISIVPCIFCFSITWPSGSPCTKNTAFGFVINEYMKFSSHSWSAWPEYPSIYSILAFTAISSPNSFTVFAPSTIFLPRVPGAWYPTNSIVLFGFQRLCFK